MSGIVLQSMLIINGIEPFAEIRTNAGSCYAAHGPNTPTWAKATIYGALGYFISPIDAIPDLVPVVGYSDDLGVLALTVATCTAYITPEVKAQAKQAKKDLWDTAFGGS